MKKIIIAILILVCSVSVKAQFNNTDTLRAFINRWIRNSAVEAFQNLRLNTALIGMTNFLDSAYGGQVLNFEAVNDTTARLVTISQDTFSIFLRGNGITALRRRSGTDSVEYLKNGSGWLYAYKDSTGGGSATLSNVGSGYRLVKTADGQIKTIFVGYGLDADSTTNTDAITVKADTSELVTPSDLADAIAGAPNPVDTIQVHTSGTTVTVSTGVNILYIDQASTLATLTITMPATPNHRGVLDIFFGGTLTSGNVVTTLTTSPNSGQTKLEASTLGYVEAGEHISYQYRVSNTKWYRKH